MKDVFNLSNRLVEVIHNFWEIILKSFGKIVTGEYTVNPRKIKVLEKSAHLISRQSRKSAKSLVIKYINVKTYWFKTNNTNFLSISCHLLSSFYKKKLIISTDVNGVKYFFFCLQNLLSGTVLITNFLSGFPRTLNFIMEGVRLSRQLYGDNTW